MGKEVFVLSEVAQRLRVAPYRITYAIAVGHVPEVAKVGGRRLFTPTDVKRIAAYFGGKGRKEEDACSLQ